MTLILSLITGATSLLLRFLPGGMFASLALGLIKNWRAAVVVGLAAIIFGGGLWAGYLGGHARGEHAGFTKGVAHHERLVREENERRTRAAVASEAVVNAETVAARKAEPTARAAKRRLCNVDANCRDRLRSSRKTRKLVSRGQLADGEADQSSQRPALGLLR